METLRPTRQTAVVGIHAVFEDSLPDAWGLAIMCQRHNLPRNKQRAAYLLELLGSEAMGTLAYTTTSEWPEKNGEAGMHY